MSMVFSYSIVLTRIVHYTDRGGNCEMAVNVNHNHHAADSPRTYQITANKIRIDDWPPTGIIRDYSHTIRN